MGKATSAGCGCIVIAPLLKCDDSPWLSTDRAPTCADIPIAITAKLASQPASGTCTDREDVVWNGTILQGAAKQYNLYGEFPVIIDPTTTYLGGTFPTAPAGAVTAVTNPSPCRSAILEITGWNQFAAPAGHNGTFNTVVFVDGVALSSGPQNEVNISGILGHTGEWERESGASVYVTIPAGGSVNIGFALRSSSAVTILFGFSAHVYKYHLTTI